MKLKEFMDIVLTMLFIGLVIWGVLSWVEVLIFNMDIGHVYSNLNMFEMILKAAGY